MTPVFGSVSILLAAGALVLLLPTLSDLLSILAVASGRGRRPQRAGAEQARFLFLVPAHDEELLIERCLESLNAVDYPPELYHVVVVADNCTDRTAELARAAGVQCLERDEPALRGKPHAIVWALERVSLADYDGMVMVDADTVLDPGYCRAMTRTPELRSKAAQAYNGVANPDENSLTRMASVLAAVYYRFIYPLKQRADINPVLTGPGMCIGTGPLLEHGWTAFSLSEDVEMYVLLTLEEVEIACVPSARIFAQEAASLGASSSQRQRWRAGRLTILKQLGSRILRQRGLSARQRLDLFVELATPGPVVHLGLVALGVTIALVLPIPGGRWVAAALAASLLRFLVYSTAAIATDRHPWRCLSAFLYLPWYGGWRLFNELGAVTRLGDKPWVRTQREPVTPDDLRQG